MNTNNKPSTAGRTTADDILQRDARFRYMLLARMQSDCEYYLDYGGRDPKRLWAGDEERQIDLMIKLHDSLNRFNDKVARQLQGRRKAAVADNGQDFGIQKGNDGDG